MRRRTACTTATLVAVVAAGTLTGHAQQPPAYPERPVRFVVPFPAGAANDVLARAVGQRLTARLGQPFIVDNRSGTGGVLGTAIAARAAPDGHTIVLVPATHAINVSLYKSPPFDAVKDFAPIAMVATAPYVLTANTTVPVKTMKDLIALAKARPGELRYASAGVGNATHLMGELMKRMAGIDVLHVPYKGGVPALTDLVGGQVQLYFGSISATAPLARAGKLRMIAVTGLRRSSAIPDVPTIDEAALPGYDADGWWMILAPARTPARIVDSLNREIVAIIGADEMRRWLLGQGFEPATATPAEVGAHLQREIVKWRKVIEASGARAD